ncbi:proton-conducting transporter membrane subunit [Candidatus Oleimmundimicrobium sp.]|uniref:proton-conducting transporter transmembrane domain-containing protein n=1 Tax=Candidatus Oleimmundimicrobium sp. TaxID=3060597 RepID=UPI002729003B|nr:proton-conducting transporter membrane subunit [Candidatus Oleimmundimicrobium sp.]MDO8886894.1 proton-conducting transporter membrane subunit [Candidatus Oleimmundimicrobium sp.]
MNQSISMFLPVAVVVLPALAGLIIFFTGNNRKLRESLSLIAAILSFLLVVALYFALGQGGKGSICCPLCLGYGFTFCLRADWLGLFFAGTTSLLWLVSVPYFIRYMEIKFPGNENRFFGFLTLSVAAAIGVAMAGNMLTLFALYELLTIFTYPLVAHTETPVVLKAAKKYLVYLLVGEMLLLFAVLSTPAFEQLDAFSKIGTMSSGIGLKMLFLIFCCYIVGFGIKAAVFPLGDWLPSVSVAPTPVTALLHAVAVVNVGLFGIMRVILNVFGLKLTRSIRGGTLLVFISCATIIYGSLQALNQNNLKKRLAFSTVEHLSYSILGVSLLNPTAFIGGLVFLISHAFLKLSLFLCAGIIDIKTGKTKVSELSGVGRKLPFISTCFAICSFGLIGMPLTLGFVGKWYLWRGPMETGQLSVMAVLIAGSVLCAFYLLYVVYMLFFKQADVDLVCDLQLNWPVYLPIGVGIFGNLFFGIFPKPLFLLIKPIITCYFGG